MRNDQKCGLRELCGYLLTLYQSSIRKFTINNPRHWCKGVLLRLVDVENVSHLFAVRF